MGKPVNEIQSSFAVVGDNISVTPVEVTDADPWTSLWGPDMDTGYFMALDIGVEGASSVTVTVLRDAGSTVPNNPATINKDIDTFAFYLGPNAEQAKKVIGLKVEGIVDGVKTTQFYDVDVNIA